MTNSTIAITNGVTGNVGSCKIEKTTVNIAPFTLQDVATNSCTGEVMTYPEYTDPGFFVGGGVVFCLFVLVFCLFVFN